MKTRKSIAISPSPQELCAPGARISRAAGSPWSRVLLAIMLVVGLVGSLKVVTAQFGVDADTSHSLMLWYGIEAHGLPWVRDWIFTQDNWLLSLVPFHFLGFLLFGPTPAVAIFFGWLIFVSSAFVSGAIVRQLGAARAALPVALALLFLGVYAHRSGFVSYSTSHNITNLFGLAALYIVLSWGRVRRPGKLLAVLALLVAGSVSDPWMVAAYDVPFALVGAALMVFPSPTIGRADGFKVLAVSAAAIVSVKTRLFGLLGFLPPMAFSRGNWATMGANSSFLIKDLGGLLNIVPFADANDALPAIVSLLVVLTLLALAAVKAAKADSADSAARRVPAPIRSATLVCAAFAVMSMGIIALALVISCREAADHSARFLINGVYLIVIGLGVLIESNWPTYSIGEKSAYALLAFLFVFSGAASNFRLWTRPGFAIDDMGTQALADYLSSNGLTYGYGPYWGANANALTATSRSAVIIRPVAFDKNDGTMIVGNRGESSKRWYTADDYPPGQKSFFVYVANDGEECADVAICLRGLSRQFGPPARTLEHGGARVLVWDHPLLTP